MLHRYGKDKRLTLELLGSKRMKRIDVGPPLGVIATLGHLWRASGHAPTGSPRARWEKRVAGLARSMPHLRVFRSWFASSAHPALKQVLRDRPSIVRCVLRPYLHQRWTPAQKLEAIGGHYRMLTGRLSFLRFAPDASVVLARLDERLQVRLDKPSWFEHEGELAINLFDGERRLYSLVFTLGTIDARSVAYVAALQGLGSPDALDVYRELTHRVHGLRPRDLLITAFRMLCSAIDIERVLAVSDACCIGRSAYFSSTAHICSSYDAVWLEQGGSAREDGFFDLPVHVERRQTSDIASRKRAMYRRRYQLLDDMDRQIGAAFARKGASVVSILRPLVAREPTSVRAAAG